ncbi:MAG TPA: ABC transporter ATP-binding protein [Verrucomicrobiae bacterium]|nr:ABC transporter ATP-binding protein [Verrucomicrobiae bacterium]
MSAEIVVAVKNVSKAYTIWASPSARLHGPMLGQIGQMPFLPARLRNSCKRLSHESFRNFYALKDISLEVAKGECLGIVGQNGSGKSTLLQVIAGILKPTMGSVEVHGKITALLELGSGFNPDFTGRENVFLNGSVLGLSTEAVRAKFDEVAAFADIGDFIDQPTKTYSSGMTVRLAFAVQATLNQDILIVDEALAVGDEAFQRKCFSRIESFRKQGGTILFVSHATNIVVELCQRAILLDGGELLLDASPKLVVAKYHKLLFAPHEKKEAVRQEIRALRSQPLLLKRATTLPDVEVTPAPKVQADTVEDSYVPGMVPQSTISFVPRGANIENPRILALDGRVVNNLVRGREYIYTYQVRFTEPAYRVRFGMLIKTTVGTELGGGASHPAAAPMEFIEAGQIARVRFRFRCLLHPSVYFMNAGVMGVVDGAEVYLHRHLDVIMFRVQEEPYLIGTGVVDFGIQPEVSFDKQTTAISNSAG